MADTLVLVPGEDLMVLERVIVAPALGVFRPYPPETVTSEGEVVAAGQVVGVVEGSGTSTPVRSAFTGFLMGLLAHEGERVREGEPVAWLRVVAA
ncbi:MAG TPA: biotin/lipoyl-containing protein [Acidimicrobiales bacterium]|nr:biotin/lipoyl-containing protein [Acidimicrobiales bacterium]